MFYVDIVNWRVATIKMKSNSEQKIDQKIDVHQDISFLFWKITMNWHRVLKKILAPHALSHADFVILTILNTKYCVEGVMQNDIVNFSSMDKMTVSKALKRLVRLGFVSRYENPVDTRAKTVNIMNIGKATLKTLSLKIERKKKEIFGNISDEKHAQLLNIMNTLAENPITITANTKEDSNE